MYRELDADERRKYQTKSKLDVARYCLEKTIYEVNKKGNDVDKKEGEAVKEGVDTYKREHDATEEKGDVVETNTKTKREQKA